MSLGHLKNYGFTRDFGLMIRNNNGTFQPIQRTKK